LPEAFGIAIECLAREALLVGSSADVAIRAIKDSGGIGEAEFGG
jgi:hypothetical protein